MAKWYALVFGLFIIVAVPSGVAIVAEALHQQEIAAHPLDTASDNVVLIDLIGSGAEEVVVNGDYAYAVIDSRLVILNITDPANPETVGQTGTLSGSIEDLALAGDYIYLANQTNGVRIIDISTPSAPTEVGVCNTPGEAWGVAVSGGYAYVADGSRKLQVCDVSPPSASTVVGSFSGLSGFGYGVAVSGSYVYVGALDLYVLSIANPEAPSYVGAYSPNTPDGIARKGVAVVGTRVFVAEYPVVPPGTGGGLRVIDISDPASPTAIGFHDTLGVPDGVAVEDHYAYVADGEGGLRVINISNPSALTEVGSYDTAGDAEEAAVVGDYVFVADKDSGLYVLRLVEPPPPPSLRYVGPTVSLDGHSEVVTEEVDHRISQGDHVHLRLPFVNRGSSPIANATVTFKGATGGDSWPGIRLATATHVWTDTLTYPLGDISPGETAYADLWLFVENLDPDRDRGSTSTYSYIKLRDGESWRLVSILVEPVYFPPTTHTAMTADDCLHHPSDLEIVQYAQYASGYYAAPVPISADPNQVDPDAIQQTITNVVSAVGLEFDYADPSLEPRMEDTILLGRRHGSIGQCRHYADLSTGLLRALGIPSRYVTAQFDDTAHTWTEVHVSGGWHNADATPGWWTAFDEGVYERRGETVRRVWADLFPLCSASSFAFPFARCTPSCYLDTGSCSECIRDRFVPRKDQSCVDDVTDQYHGVGLAAQFGMAADELLVTISAPASVTRTVSFTLCATIVNSTTAALDMITATVVVSGDVESTAPLYDVEDRSQVVTNVGAGQTVTVTWVATPLVSGILPLQVEAESATCFVFDGQPQVVNEPGTLPDLMLVATSEPGNISPGQSITLTADVLDESLRPITGTAAAITATVHATPTQGFSATVALSCCAPCGQYQQVVDLPVTVPAGRYWVGFTATRPGYDSDTSQVVFWVSPPLSAALTANSDVLYPLSALTLTVSVHDRGTPVTSAGVWANVATSVGTVTLPLMHVSGADYVASFRPWDLSANLGGALPIGEWQVTATAEHYGGSNSDETQVTVRGPVYLPLVLRGH